MVQDIYITDFSDPAFQRAFQTYFGELDVPVADWSDLFREMNETGENEAYMRLSETGEVIGFIQFCGMRFDSWFFSENCGFVREFWVDAGHRNRGHGRALLALAEARMAEQGIRRVLLTTDTAEEFYRRSGYRTAPEITARNKMNVYAKVLFAD